MQAAGVLKEVPFQFCGNDLIGLDIKLAGPKLDRDQALLVTSQVFAFNGARDTLTPPNVPAGRADSPIGGGSGKPINSLTTFPFVPAALARQLPVYRGSRSSARAARSSAMSSLLLTNVW